MKLYYSKQNSDQRRLTLAKQVRDWSVSNFHSQLEKSNVYRAYILFENGEFTLSHPKHLAPIQAFLELSQDFAQHEGIFIGREDGIATLFFAFVHDTRRGLAQGGLRFWRYESLADVLVDGLRLSQGMTRKNALAGLWWGGGKGIIPLLPGLNMPDELQIDNPKRKQLFQAYGRFVASLCGAYYTAEDVGTKTADMDAILSQNRFTTCISKELGGSGNPSPFTAQGVFRGMQAAWKFLTGSEDLKGVRVAVQGVGNVGRPLIEILDDASAQVWIADVYEPAVKALIANRKRVQVVSPDEIFDLDVDILAPCARGGVINADTIPRLKVRLICGAANNILLEEKYDSERLWRRNISFVPDYVCNRMGITNCCDEWLGYLAEDIRVAAERVYPDTLRVLKHAHNLFISPTKAANELADIAASELHPILGHRGRRIIDYLIASNWTDVNQTHTKAGQKRIFDSALDEPRIRVAWEKQGRVYDHNITITAAPIPAVSSPNLSSLTSPLLADIRVRSLELLTGKKPRPIMGSDHGGLALQLAIERFLPYERQEVGRAEFSAMCRDFYNRNDAAIRERLHQLGVGFNPNDWLDTMGEEGKRVVNWLFYALQDAGLIVRENRWAYHCPRCETVLVASDVSRTKLTVDHHYLIHFKTKTGELIETKTYFPDLVLGAVAIAVNKGGPFSQLARKQKLAINPVSGKKVPVIVVDDLAADAMFLVPAHLPKDDAIARAHNINERVTVFDEKGYVSIPDYAHLPLEEVRQKVLECIGENATRISNTEAIDAHRCKRCESIVYHRFSEQLFVKIETGVEHLRNAIVSGAVRFSHTYWQDKVLSYLNEIEPWCISRQQWWGNEIPTYPHEVLSTWFSLAAWSLQGAGWPNQASPAPITEVFADPDLLIRWIVPSQMVALMITGRPAFQKIHVHGGLHIIERFLTSRPGVSEVKPDEERFLFRVKRRPMRLSLGNVVQPSTLIRRFGADALRLGYLLCVDIGSDKVATASESKLKQARKSVHLLVAKLTGILNMLPEHEGEARIADRFMLAQILTDTEAARKAYEEVRFTEAAHIFINTIETFSRYANLIAMRRREGHDLGAVQTTAVGAIAQMEKAFSPICPFLFEKIGPWMREKYPAAETTLAVNSNLENLVELLSRSPFACVEIEASKVSNLKISELDRLEIERLAQKQIAFK